MSDSVPPTIQQFELRFPARAARVKNLCLCPQAYAQAAEIGAYARRLCVAAIQLPAPREISMNEPLGENVGNLGRHEVFDTFRMQVSTKTLELRCEQYSVCVIDLIDRVPSSGFRAANRHMGLFELLESNRSHSAPLSIGTRRRFLRLSLSRSVTE
jgi:hypothetical protein